MVVVEVYLSQMQPGLAMMRYILCLSLLHRQHHARNGQLAFAGCAQMAPRAEKATKIRHSVLFHLPRVLMFFMLVLLYEVPRLGPATELSTSALNACVSNGCVFVRALPQLCDFKALFARGSAFVDIIACQ
mmetsp:Transcript_91415/g.293649  ORF Transcript_91415/g.293649 Transcript_91415/m.293649 type:complete len:131 (-) Transcript_91415:96-488(-)